MNAEEKRRKKEDERRELAATVLFECGFATDESVAERYAITIRTVTNYRRQLASDPLLRGVLASRREAFEREWAARMPEALVRAINIVERISEAMANDPTFKANPLALEKAAEAFKTIAEVYITNRFLDARFAGKNREASRPAGEEISAGRDGEAGERAN